MQFQFGADDDHGTAGIVNAFTQQVLTETSLFAFQHIGQRFQRTFVRARDGAAAAAVVEQSVNGFLQHTFFVADDDFRRAQFNQPFQTVVAVDDAAVQIVQVGRRETAAVQRNQRAQFGRNDRNDIQNHPFGFRSGFQERFDQLQTLDQLFAAGFRRRGTQFGADGFGFLFQINGGQDFLQRFGADAGAERILAVFLDGALILFFGQQFVDFQRGQPRFDHDILFKVQNRFQILQHDIDQQADAAGQGFQKPDVRDRRGQFDVPHAFAAHFGQRDFHAAFFADDAAEFHAFVFSAQAFVVLDGPENAGAEQTVSFRFESAVVDRFGLFDFAVRPGTDTFRRRQRDLNLIKRLCPRYRTENFHKFVH